MLEAAVDAISGLLPGLLSLCRLFHSLRVGARLLGDLQESDHVSKSINVLKKFKRTLKIYTFSPSDEILNRKPLEVTV